MKSTLAGVVLFAILPLAQPSISRAEEFSHSCRGMLRSFHCGNLKCEPRLGESSETCPGDCPTTAYHSYDYQTVCPGSHPPHEVTTAADAAAQILGASKVRIAGTGHTANSQICTDDVLLTTSKLKEIEGPFLVGGEKIVRLQGGVTLEELAEYLYKRGLTIGFSHPQYKKISVIGVMQTGSHGSSLTHNASMETQLRGIRLITADGLDQVFFKSSTPHDLWKALTVTLGSLGYIHEIYLAVEDDFHLETTWKQIDEHKFLSGDVPSFGPVCDVNQLIWYPVSQTLFSWCGNKTELPAMKGAESTFINNNIPKWEREIARFFLHMGRCSKLSNHLAESLRISALKKKPPLRFINAKGKLQYTNRIVAPSKDLILSYWDPTAPFVSAVDYSVSIPPRYRMQALRDVREFLVRHRHYLPIFGVNLRFNPINDDSWLGLNASGGDFPVGDYALIMEFFEYQPRHLSPARARAFLEPMQGFIASLVRNYGARLHWGKNTDDLFRLAKDTGSLSSNVADFAAIRSQMDPENKFENEFLRSIGL